MTEVRTQLSLYVPVTAAAALDAVRRAVDPIQRRLIPPHVTLCRDEELAGLTPSVVRARLAGASMVTLTFGRAERFFGHGVLLPCVEGLTAFRALRARILGSPTIREAAPHLTLAHPRNPSAVADPLAAAQVLAERLVVTLPEVHWIEQEAGGKWGIRHTFQLGTGL